MKKKLALIAITALSVSFLSACSSKEDTTSTSSTTESTNLVSSTETVVSSSSSTEAVNSDFNPTDTSDSTIESIVTYNDYLKMYEAIVNEYISNYEAVVSQYGLGDAESYQSMRDSVTSSVETQKEAYGSLGNARITGKDSIVEYLKNYRDNLKSSTDQMAIALQ